MNDMDDRASAICGGFFDLLRQVGRNVRRTARQPARVADRDVNQNRRGESRIDRRLRDDARTRGGFVGEKAARRAVNAPAPDLVAAEEDGGRRASVMRGRQPDIFQIGARSREYDCGIG